MKKAKHDAYGHTSPLIRYLSSARFLLEGLPGCFATGEHTPDSCDNQADRRDAAHNIPPVLVAYQRGNQAIDQAADNADKTGDGAKYDTQPQQRQRKDQPFAERAWVVEVEFRQVDKQ